MAASRLMGSFVAALALPAAPAQGAVQSPAVAPPPAAAPAGAQDGNARKEAWLLRIADELDASVVRFLGGGHVAAAEERVAQARAQRDPSGLFNALLARCDAHIAAGDPRAATDDAKEALEIARQRNDLRAWQRAARAAATAWLRLGEQQNCVTRHNEDSCLFPLRGGALHVDRTGSEQAALYLEAVLKVEPGDLASAWLLNVARMTLGEWPDKVPPLWRIPARALEPERVLPRMRDIAAQVGVAHPDLAGGAVVDDFDGDGWLEIVSSSMGSREPIKFCVRRADGTYADEAAQRGLAGQIGGLQIHAFDANNDGRLDLAVQRGAWLGDQGRWPNSLLIQQEDGRFVDRTLEAGVESAMPGQVACSADVDGDGDLDLFLGHEHHGGHGATAYPCQLFLNRGDATFEDATERAGVANLRICKGAAFGDYDRDGDPDLYVSNLADANRLYRNRGDGTFEDVTEALGVIDPLDSFACWFFDADQDGWLDLFVTGYDQHDRSAQMAAWHRNGTTGFDTMRLYRNDRKGGFVDATREMGMARVCFPMGASFGDVDEDGFDDVYLGTGDPEFAALWPNVMLRNDDGRRFEDVTAATGTGHLQKGHGVAFGDLDNDGDQDLFVQMGGAWRSDGFADALYENPGHGHRWLTVRLRGRTSNRFGVGARLRVVVEEEGREREIWHHAGQQSSFGGNSLQAEIGLRRAGRILALEVEWPWRRGTQRFTDVPLDSVVRIDEGSERLEVLPVAPPPAR